MSPVSARGALRRVHSGRDGGEERLGVGKGLLVAADHQAVATLAAPHATAGTTVQQVNSLLAQQL